MNGIDPNQARIQGPYRGILIVWCGLLMTLPIYLVIALVVAAHIPVVDNRAFHLALVAISIAPAALSILIKQKMLAKAVEKQQPILVFNAYLVALALCESSALFGLVDNFVTGSSYYYFALGIAAIGMLLHFPKKDHVRAASFKQF